LIWNRICRSCRNMKQHKKCHKQKPEHGNSPEKMKQILNRNAVIPAKAGIQTFNG
jgi:hypothetical protein